MGAAPPAPASVTEAATQTFGAPATSFGAPTQYVNSNPTGPAYMAPPEMSPPMTAPAGTTQGLERKTGKRNALLIGGVAFFLFLAVVSVLIFLSLRRLLTPAAPAPPVVAAPEIPVPPVPAVPDIPPPPVPPSTGGAEGVANSSLVYPGAETMMNITQEDGGGMLQLRTTDPFEKVFDWYVAKIKPTKTIRTPGFTSTAILRAEGVTAIITAAGGDQTTIMIKQEADQ